MLSHDEFTALYSQYSEAIEAAHRNVIQQRLKLSGQRWTKKGRQQIFIIQALL